MFPKTYISKALITLLISISLTCVTTVSLAIAKPKKNTNSMGASVKYSTYYNSRFGFSIKYPSNFKKLPPPENGDGQIFVSPDGKAKLTASGSNNVLSETAKDLYEQMIMDIQLKGSEPAYKVLRKNWFVVSWIEDGQIYYYKQIVDSGSMNSFMFSYPKSKAKYYNPITTVVANSFKPGNLSTGNPGWTGN